MDAVWRYSSFGSASRWNCKIHSKTEKKEKIAFQLLSLSTQNMLLAKSQAR